MTTTDFISVLATLSAVSTITDTLTCLIFAGAATVVGVYFYKRLNK